MSIQDATEKFKAMTAAINEGNAALEKTIALAATIPPNWTQPSNIPQNPYFPPVPMIRSPTTPISPDNPLFKTSTGGGGGGGLSRDAEYIGRKIDELKTSSSRGGFGLDVRTGATR